MFSPWPRRPSWRASCRPWLCGGAGGALADGAGAAAAAADGRAAGAAAVGAAAVGSAAAGSAGAGAADAAGAGAAAAGGGVAAGGTAPVGGGAGGVAAGADDAGVAAGSGLSTTASVEDWRAAASAACFAELRLLVGGMGQLAFSVRWWMWPSAHGSERSAAST